MIVEAVRWSQVRRDVLEEAARLCDAWAKAYPGDPMAAERLAVAIRALADQETARVDEHSDASALDTIVRLTRQLEAWRLFGRIYRSNGAESKDAREAIDLAEAER